MPAFVVAWAACGVSDPYREGWVAVGAQTTRTVAHGSVWNAGGDKSSHQFEYNEKKKYNTSAG